MKTKIKSYLKKIIPRDLRLAIEKYLELKRIKKKKKCSLKKIKKLLNDQKLLKIELGATKSTSSTGWLTIDIDDDADIWWDLTEQLPFPDNSVASIYSSHVLEHFSYYKLLDLLNESRRVLVDAGMFRACVPNARLYIDAYKDEKSEFNPTEYCTIRKAYHGNGKIDLINYIAYMRMHHKYMFDEENIVNILKKVNFSEVELASFDQRYDDVKRKKESIYVTSVKHPD